MNRELVRVAFGSTLYGTRTPASDTDYKAVHVPDPREILMCRARSADRVQTKADKTKKNSPDDVDMESWAIRHFLGLVAGGNTGALDLLFAPEWAQVNPAATSPIWRVIQEEGPRRLVTKQSATFVDYCKDQAGKYGLKGTRVAAGRDVVRVLKAAIDEHGPHARVSIAQAELRALAEAGGGHVKIHEVPAHPRRMPGAAEGPQATISMLDVCDVKAPFTWKLQHTLPVYQKFVATYGARALMAETNEGVDWKAVSHAFRVCWEAIELLETGRITFPRPEAARLVSIKTGRERYSALAEELADLVDVVKAAAGRSVLRDEPDVAFMEDVVFEAHKTAMRKYLDDND